MENNDLWPRIWQKLYANGASSKQEEGTRRYWVTLTPEQQESVFTAITQKLEKGKFVWYDPIRAIQENLRRKGKQAQSGPTDYNHRALPDVPVFSAKYNGEWGMYTQEDIDKYGMEKAG